MSLEVLYVVEVDIRPLVVTEILFHKHNQNLALDELLRLFRIRK